MVIQSHIMGGERQVHPGMALEINVQISSHSPSHLRNQTATYQLTENNPDLPLGFVSHDLQSSGPRLSAISEDRPNHPFDVVSHNLQSSQPRLNATSVSEPDESNESHSPSNTPRSNQVSKIAGLCEGSCPEPPIDPLVLQTSRELSTLSIQNPFKPSHSRKTSHNSLSSGLSFASSCSSVTIPLHGNATYQDWMSSGTFRASTSHWHWPDIAAEFRSTLPHSVHSPEDHPTERVRNTHAEFPQATLAGQSSYANPPGLSSESSYLLWEKQRKRKHNLFDLSNSSMRRSARLENMARVANEQEAQEVLQNNAPPAPSGTTMTDDNMDIDENEGTAAQQYDGAAAQEPGSSPKENTSPQGSEGTLEIDPNWTLSAPTNIPASWEFAIYEDSPDAPHSRSTPLGEGFSFEEEDKENIPPMANDAEEEDDEDMDVDVDWGEVEQMPRDAFGRPIARDGRTAIPERAPLGRRRNARHRGRRGRGLPPPQLG